MEIVDAGGWWDEPEGGEFVDSEEDWPGSDWQQMWTTSTVIIC